MGIQGWDCGQRRLEEEEEKLFPDTQDRHSSAGGSRLLEEVLAGLCLVPPSGLGNPQLRGVRQPVVQTRMWSIAPQPEKPFPFISHSDFI